jgi:hypothetical protein
MIGLIIFLLVVWLILTVVGITIKGLFWLAIIGGVLFLATAIWGWVRRGSGTT